MEKVRCQELQISRRDQARDLCSSTRLSGTTTNSCQHKRSQHRQIRLQVLLIPDSKPKAESTVMKLGCPPVKEFDLALPPIPQRYDPYSYDLTPFVNPAVSYGHGQEAGLPVRETRQASPDIHIS